MVFCRQFVDKCGQQKKRGRRTKRCPLFSFILSPLCDVIHHRNTLISPAVKMCKSLKASLLIADRHKCLAINDGRARLNAVILGSILKKKTKNRTLYYTSVNTKEEWFL